MRVSPNLETGCKKFVHNKEKLKKILSKTVTTLQAVHKQYTAEADSSTLYGGATAGRSPAALPLKWQNDKLLCTEQWPRTKKKKVKVTRTAHPGAARASTYRRVNHPLEFSCICH